MPRLPAPLFAAALLLPSYNDPFTGTRQSPDYSRGIRFTRPEESLAGYVKILREQHGLRAGLRAVPPGSDPAAQSRQ